MLVKLFFKQWQLKSSVSGMNLSQLCLGYPRLLLLSLPLSSKQSQKQVMSTTFTAVSMVCVTGLFTQSVASTYNGQQLTCML